MAGGFRSSVWDPRLIVSQIVAVQCFFYVFLGLWFLIIDAISGQPLSIEQFYQYDQLQFKTTTGKLVMCAFFLNSLSSAMGLWYIVKRTKMCLDFAGTVHVFHLVICWAYNAQFPSTVSWWVTNTVGIVLMTVLGEFLCLRTEMQEIPVMSSKVDL